MSAKPAVPAKISGQTVTATEVNAIVDFFAGKPDPAEVAPIAHVGAGGAAHSNVVAAGAAGFMTGADKTKLDGVATGANNYAHPNHSGDVTSAGDGAQTIAANAVTNAKAAQMATKTYKGRTTAAIGNAEDVPVATLKADLLLVKADVGLATVDNTADSVKPVSTAQQAALNEKAPIASPTFTGTVTAPLIVSTGVVRLKNYTVATLPTGVQGDTVYVTDQLTAVNAKGAAPTGGGTVVCVQFYNGAVWVGI